MAECAHCAKTAARKRPSCPEVSSALVSTSWRRGTRHEELTARCFRSLSMPRSLHHEIVSTASGASTCPSIGVGSRRSLCELLGRCGAWPAATSRVSRVWGLARCCIVSRRSFAGLSGNQGDSRCCTAVFGLRVVEVLYPGITLNVVLHGIGRIVPWPCDLGLIVIGCVVEWLMVVGLIELRVGVGHPAFILLHVVELGARSRPVELVRRACRGWVV